MGDEERKVVGEIVASGLSVAGWCAATGRMGTTKAYRILNWFSENDPSAFGAGEEAARDQAIAERDAAVAERDALREGAEGLKTRINVLGDQTVVLRRQAFGPGSETLRATLARKRACPGQMALAFNDVEAAAEGEFAESAAEGEGARGEGRKKKPRKPRTPIDLGKWEDLTTVEHHRLPEGEGVCPQCGAEPGEMGYDVVRELAYVPGHIEVTEHRTHKYNRPRLLRGQQGGRGRDQGGHRADRAAGAAAARHPRVGLTFMVYGEQATNKGKRFCT